MALVGEGTVRNPFSIKMIEDFVGIAKCPNAFFKLENDIDFEKTMMMTNSGFKFGGVLDGNGHCIKNLMVRCENFVSVGLFQEISESGIVKNLKVVDAFVVGEGFVGVIAGINRGKVINCVVESGVVQAYYNAGGAVGVNFDGAKIQNCRVDAIVVGNVNVGGLVGSSLINSLMLRCDVRGKLCGIENLGGVVGQNYGSMIDCASSAELKGRSDYGKLVGLNRGEIKLKNNEIFNKYYDRILVFAEIVGRNWAVL